MATSLVGCTDTDTRPDISEPCEDLVDVAIEAILEARDSAEGISPLELERVTPESREIADAYLEDTADIQRRSQAFNCDHEALSEEYERRLTELEVGSAGGAFILLEAFGSLNPFDRIE